MHGFNKARAIVSTPFPNIMRINVTNTKWKERSNVDSRQVDSTLVVDEDEARAYEVSKGK